MPESPKPPIKPGDPYCSNCGYSLVGATETAVCPECGRPLVEVLVRGRVDWSQRGKRYRSEARLFGVPIIDIALGPHGDERIGRARGIIAIGDRAVGWLAIGNASAVGVVAIGGGAALGVVGIGGGIGCGLLSTGGCAVGGLAIGGGAVGALASGGGAIGYFAQGGAALGVYARGGGAVGVHTISPLKSDPQAVSAFKQVEWFMGPVGTPLGIVVPIADIAMAALVLSVAIGLLALVGSRRGRRTSADSGGGWSGARP